METTKPEEEIPKEGEESAPEAETPPLHAPPSFPSTATLEDLKEVLTEEGEVPVVGEVFFIAAWTVFAKVLVKGEEHTVGVTIAGIQGPHIALNAEYLNPVKEFLKDKTLFVTIDYNEIPYYLFGDVRIEGAQYLSEYLIAGGLARVCTPAKRIDEICAVPTRPSRFGNPEPSVRVSGEVVAVLSGDVVEMEDYDIDTSEIDNNAVCPLAEWYRDFKEERPKRIRIVLEGIRSPRQAGGSDDIFALETKDITRRLLFLKKVSVHVTSAWHSVEEIGEVLSELHDTKHLRGTIFFAATEAEVKAATRESGPASRQAVQQYCAQQQQASSPLSLSVILAAMGSDVKLKADLSTTRLVPWVELLQPEDYMCPISNDVRDCLRYSAAAKVQRFTRDLSHFKCKELTPSVFRRDTSLKWVYNRNELCEQKGAEECVIEDLRCVLVSGKSLLRATVCIRKNLLGLKQESDPTPDDAPVLAKEMPGAVADGVHDVEEMVTTEDAEAMEKEKDEREDEGHGYSDVCNYFVVDVYLVAKGTDAADWEADAAAALATPHGETRCIGMDSTVDLRYVKTVGGRQQFFGVVVTSEGRRAETYKRHDSFSTLTQGKGFEHVVASNEVRADVRDFLKATFKEDSLIAKVLAHTRGCHPVLDKVSSKYLAFQPRIPKAAKIRCYKGVSSKSFGKRNKVYPETVDETVDGIPRLSKFQYERLPPRQGQFSVSPFELPAGVAAAQDGTPRFYFRNPALLRLLAQNFLFAFSGKETNMKLMIKREGKNLYSVHHLGSMHHLVGVTQEELETKDSAFFGEAACRSHAFRFVPLKKTLSYHYGTRPLWTKGFAEKVAEDDPLEDPPVYTLGGSGLITQGAPLVYKSGHADDDDEGARVLIHESHGFEWGPNYGDRLRRGGWVRVAAQYRSNQSRTRQILRTYGCTLENELSFLQKSRRRRFPLRYLLLVLQERAKGIPAKGVLVNIFTVPCDRVTAVYMYTNLHLAIQALKSLPKDVQKEWRPSSAEEVEAQMDKMHGKLMANIETVLRDVVLSELHDYTAVNLTLIGLGEDPAEDATRTVVTEVYPLENEEKARDLQNGLFQKVAADQHNYTLDAKLNLCVDDEDAIQEG